MKKIFVLATIALLSCMTVNAQDACAAEENETPVLETSEVTTNTPDESTELNPVVYSNSYIMSLKAPEMDLTQSSVVVNENYKQDKAYKSGKALRTAGIITTAVGGAWTGFMGIAAISCSAQNKNAFGDLGAAVLGWWAAAGVPVIGAGVTMWLCGNHKMKKVKAASTGVGLAYVF